MLVFVVIVLLVLYSGGSAFRKARKLDARIAEFKREQEERKKAGVVDPYSELASLYSENADKKNERRH